MKQFGGQRLEIGVILSWGVVKGMGVEKAGWIPIGEIVFDYN
jgi:hypothetical protein